MTNTGHGNTGHWNTGNNNPGDRNTGEGNTGHWNTGNNNPGERNTNQLNLGNWNTGERNPGDHNAGNRNTGNWNNGNFNPGERNSGNFNTGNNNSGDWNTGNNNSGNWNTGNNNSGNWNTGHGHTGCFNSKAPEEAYYFNKLGSVDAWEDAEKPVWIYRVRPTEWVASSDMTDAEKQAHPSHEAIGGYLRVNDMKEQYQKAYEAASEEDRELTRQLPNFDPEVLLEITGVDMRDPNQPREIEIDGVVYTLVPKQN